MIDFVLWLFDIKLDVLSREDAALEIIGRDVRVKWRPLILCDPPEDFQ
jgi:hypothetical protein